VIVIKIQTEWFDRSEEPDVMQKTEGSFPGSSEKVLRWPKRVPEKAGEHILQLC